MIKKSILVMILKTSRKLKILNLKAHRTCLSATIPETLRPRRIVGLSKTLTPWVKPLIQVFIPHSWF